ncbi:MAG: protein kinase [Myxococcota bacterium]|nr:protein kinase [Myxococcota bacterium]
MHENGQAAELRFGRNGILSMAAHDRSNFGNYVLEERIGVGGMAEIFLASADVGDTRQRLVIKRILSHLSDDESFVRMFIEEAKLCVLLRHSNVVQVYDLGVVDDQYFIAMEYVEGRDLLKTLAACARQRVAFPTDLALHIVLQVLKALEYAHNLRGSDGQPMNIIHRDVSPPNVLLSYDGAVKLSDFGIAKASFREKTRTGIFKGKFGYMSPEQAMGEELDQRSDLFAVGILLYELLTGRRLFTGPNEVAIIEKVRTATIHPPLLHHRPDISKTLHDIVMKSLARRRDDRFSSAAELHEAIYNYTFHNGVVLSPRSLTTFMNRIFPVEKRSAGEPVLNEPSWSNASSLLFSDKGRRNGEYSSATPLVSSDEEDELLTLDGTESEEEYILSQERSMTSKIGDFNQNKHSASDEDASVDDNYTHDRTPFGGVPVLEFESTAQKLEVLDDPEKSNIETIQGDEEDILEEIRSFSSQASSVQSNLEIYQELDENDDNAENTAISLDESNIESTDAESQSELEVTGYILKPEINEPNSTGDGSSPFSKGRFDADSDFVEHTKAESLPSSVLELLESAVERTEHEPTRPQAPAEDPTDLQPVVDTGDESDLPTSMGMLEEMGSPEEVAAILGLEADDDPAESTGVREALSEAALADEEIEEIRRASLIEEPGVPPERTALGALIDVEEALSISSPKDDIWSASSSNLTGSDSPSEAEPSTASAFENDPYFQNDETIERNLLDEEGKKDVEALAVKDEGRLKDPGASGLFGALDLLDDEESLGAFPSSFEGTDLSITDFSDNVSAIVADPATNGSIGSPSPRKEILAPSVIAARERNISFVSDSDDEQTANFESVAPVAVRARSAPSRPESSRVRPKTSESMDEDRTPYAPGSLIPPAEPVSSELPGFVPDSESRDFKSSGAGLLSDSFDLASKRSNPQKPQVQDSTRAPSVRADPKPPPDLRVRMSGEIRVENGAPVVRPVSIRNADTRTLPGQAKPAIEKVNVGFERDEFSESFSAGEQLRPSHESAIHGEDSGSRLPYIFAVGALIFAMSAGLLYTFDATGTGIRRAIGILGDEEGRVIRPGESSSQLDGTQLRAKAPVLTSTPAKDSTVPPSSSIKAPSPAESQAKKQTTTTSVEDQKQEPAKTEPASSPKETVTPAKSRPEKKTIKKRSSTKKKRKVLTKKKRPRRKFRRPKKKKITRKFSKPLAKGKGSIRWECREEVTVKIRRIGVFKATKRERVQVKPGSYRISIQQADGSMASKFIRVIEGQNTKLPCD